MLGPARYPEGWSGNDEWAREQSAKLMGQAGRFLFVVQAARGGTGSSLVGGGGGGLIGTTYCRDSRERASETRRCFGVRSVCVKVFADASYAPKTPVRHARPWASVLGF